MPPSSRVHALCKAGAAMLGLLSAACSSPAAPAAPAGDALAGDRPPKTNRVVLAVEAPAVESNNPRQICCNDTAQARPLYENLIGMDATSGKLTPQLATNWAVEPDGKGVRFTLRKGIRYNNPQWGEVTSKDVVHAYTHATLFEDSHSQTPYWKRTVVGNEVVNDSELVLKVNPDANFFNAISENYAQVLIRSKAEYDAVGDLKDPSGTPYTGTGPFVYDSRAIGQYIRFKRVENHWRAKPDFPEYEIRWVKEASTRLASLLTGEVHMTKVGSDLQAQALRQGMKLVTNKVPGPRVMGTFYYQWYDREKGIYSLANSPLGDARVRQALNKAIDRQALTKAFAPSSEPMVANHLFRGQDGYRKEWETKFPDLYGYDPAKARSLLADAGFTPANPYRIGILLGDILQIANANDVMEAIGAQWRAVGIDVTLINMDAGTRAAAGRAQKFDNHFSIVGTGIADASYGILIYNSGYGAPAPRGLVTPELVQMVQRQQTQLDPAKQVPEISSIVDWGFNNFWDVPLWWVPVEVLVNPAYVADWTFPGAANGTWSHPENIKAAR